MDYEKAWKSLKEWIELALDEGEERGFDVNNYYGDKVDRLMIEESEFRKLHGKYTAFASVMREMEFKEDHYKN
jgi:hypothetical protein